MKDLLARERERGAGLIVLPFDLKWGSLHGVKGGCLEADTENSFWTDAIGLYMW